MSGHTVDALMCFVDMMAAGFQPDLTMYSALMNALSDQGAFHQCCNLLATVKRNGITANVQLYTAVIASLRTYTCTYASARPLTCLLRASFPQACSACVSYC